MTVEQPSYRFVPETRHGVWGGFRAFWEATGEAAYLGNPLSEEYVADGVSYQVFERGKLRWREGEDIAMAPVGEMLAVRYDIAKTPQPQGSIPVYDESLFVPPVAIPALDAAPPAPERWPRGRGLAQPAGAVGLRERRRGFAAPTSAPARRSSARRPDSSP